MTRLIEDLLDVSGMTMGKVKLKKETFDLARLATRVARTWEHAGTSTARTVDLDVEEVWIKADRVRIEQVLINLLENAGKFSPAEGTLRVRVARERGRAVMAVADDGEGIQPDQLRKIFGLFVQGESGPARTRGGMGVGLALVKQLVEMHGGTVAAASAGRGHGATFTVRLPAVSPAPAPASASASAPATDESVSGHFRALRLLRILVTEDNDDVREMMRTMLSMDGHDVRVARTGTESLAMLEEWHPDVALIDIGLPDMEGYEIARRVGETDLRRRIKLIALTGFGQNEDERRAYDAGFDLHLIKPVALDVLRDVLAALTGRPYKV
jgi:CheY-like chemotaxis protein